MNKPLPFALALLLAGTASANHLTVANVRTAPTVAPYAGLGIVADVQWENSWRDNTNWDAAWLFVKFRPRAGGVWRHATLGTADAAYGVPAGAALNAATDGKGAFVYRAAPGGGTFAAPAVQLHWNYAADGLSSLAAGYELQVMGVEMVYVPQEAFNLNATPSAALSNEFIGVGGSLTQIASEAALPAGALRWANETGGGGTGNALAVGGSSYPGSAALGPDYPKGYAATYCMKYEVSQGQYTDFLNSLTRPQQAARIEVNIAGDAPAGGLRYVMASASTAAAASRNTITCPAAGMGTTAPVVFGCTRPDRAANFLIWADGAAYLDWAGLRPLSELEYEKACRGPLPAVANEYAWGSTVLGRAAAISGAEDGTETTDAAANCVYNVSGATPFVPFVGGDGGDGPLRCGVFARAATTREQAGATYYGIMEMSGNCWERCVTVAGFDGTSPTPAAAFSYLANGDGALAATGAHDVAAWPNSTDVLGSNYRGGNWSRHREWAMVSDRTYGGNAIPGRTSHRSIRGTRSAATANPPVAVGATGASPVKFRGGAYDGYARATIITPTSIRAGGPAGATAVLLPNPVADAATLRLSGRPPLTDATLTLTDARGRVVRRQAHLSGLELHISRAGLAPGLYQYQVSEGGEVAVPAGRFVVE